MLTQNCVLYIILFSILSRVRLVYCISLCLNILCVISDDVYFLMHIILTVSILCLILYCKWPKVTILDLC